MKTSSIIFEPFTETNRSSLIIRELLPYSNTSRIIGSARLVTDENGKETIEIHSLHSNHFTKSECLQSARLAKLAI